jgi:hypothetical protein
MFSLEGCEGFSCSLRTFSSWKIGSGSETGFGSVLKPSRIQNTDCIPELPALDHIGEFAELALEPAPQVMIRNTAAPSLRHFPT